MSELELKESISELKNRYYFEIKKIEADHS